MIPLNRRISLKSLGTQEITAGHGTQGCFVALKVGGRGHYVFTPQEKTSRSGGRQGTTLSAPSSGAQASEWDARPGQVKVGCKARAGEVPAAWSHGQGCVLRRCHLPLGRSAAVHLQGWTVRASSVSFMRSHLWIGPYSRGQASEGALDPLQAREMAPHPQL